MRHGGNDMAFGGIEIGSVTRMQDISIIKHNEDNKSVIDQGNISMQVEKQVDSMMHEVHESDHAEWYDKKPDASEKGNNEYTGDGGKKRKNPRKVEQMVIKGRGSFDIKI